MSKGKRRKHFKIEDLPKDIRAKVDEMLASQNPRYTYEEIQFFLFEEGHPIGKSSIARYHNSFERITERITETREKLKVLVDAVRDQPGTDLAEVANQLMMQGLLQRVAQAEDEFESISLEKAGRLIASLERSAVQREKLKYEFDKGVSQAVEKVKLQLHEELKNDPDLYHRLVAKVDQIHVDLTAVT
ncbi:phage protein Gp27 family protein [Paenibacillus naphthalenovorans]|uniref:phage protein Gp27 family protein n=1 Tax=Paenibacillus naphthalenovorans TaxID=162209 RepID=UPI00088891CE|nr:phage protein Gp27 family protein [Paenibacillus naphthalenovorans]SDI49485.1 Protein of unknown function [Paenibacillus naphthalenovorans]